MYQYGRSVNPLIARDGIRHATRYAAYLTVPLVVMHGMALVVMHQCGMYLLRSGVLS